MSSPLRRLLPYLLRYRCRYAVGAACVIGSVALRFAVPYLLGDSIDVLRSGTDLSVDQLHRLILIGAATMVGAAAIGALVRTASRVLILGNSRHAVNDVRADVFARLLLLAPSFYARHRTGDVMSRCVNDMQNVQGLLGPVFLYLVETGVLFGIGLTFMLAADPLLTVVGLAPFPFFLVATRRLAQRVQEGSRLAQEQLGEISAKVDESISGHRVVKNLAIEDHDRERFVARCGRYSDTMLAVARTRATLTSLMPFLAALGTFSVLVAGAPLVRSGSVTVGEIVSLVLYLGLLAAPIRTLGFVLSSLQRGAAALARIGELLDMPVTIDDRGADGTARIENGALEVRGLTIDLPAEEAPLAAGSAARNGGTRRVLSDVSFTVAAGSTVGIVGPIGAGKSTLLRALTRQVEVEPGQIFVDGHDITVLPLGELRGAVGLAPQDAFLFSDTLADNVRFGAPQTERQRVLEAVAAVRLDRDLLQLADGVDTMLGERGVNLSGGQRQRTSLARIVLLRPRILLLDDTLSAVDAETSSEILAALRPLLAGRTTVIVAHRLRTVRDADQILVLDGGRLIESGTHDELMALGGYYATVYTRQSTQEEIIGELGREAP